MPDAHFTNLLIVVAVGLIAPLTLGFFPRLRLPAIGLEIVLGIVIGPSGLGWVKRHDPQADRRRVRAVIRDLQDTTAQIRVRAAFVLLIGFTALAEQVGLATILGAFAAGTLLSTIDRDDMTHPQFRLKLEAAGFGVFIPVFFVTSGVRFDLNALFATGSTVARVPLFLLAIYLARGL